MITRRTLLAASPLVALPWFCSRGWALEDVSDTVPLAEWTPDSRRSIERGTEWLMRAMNRDGSAGVDIGQPADIGCTAMVGLALLSQGNTPNEGRYASQVRAITNYLLRQCENMPTGDITAQTQTQLQNKIGRHAHTFFATVFLCEVAGEGFAHEPVARALRKLVKAITTSQTPDGHWGTTAWAPVLGTVMGWVALSAANFVGLYVGSSPERTAQYLIRQLGQGAGRRGENWMHQLYKEASGIRVLYAMEMEEEPAARQALENVLSLVTRSDTAFLQAGGEEYLAFHLLTETLLQKGDQDWHRWFPTVRDKLIRVQNRDGSWTGHHCITSRTFCTAGACLVLSAPNRYLPISQP